MAVHKITSLTFRHDLEPLFTTAVDQDGLMYRVLFAAGGRSGDTAQYYLSPWAPDNKATSHRGRTITASSPLLSAIEQAEAERRRLEEAKAKDKPFDFSRFMADEI